MTGLPSVIPAGKIVLEGCSGPGGWSVFAAQLGLPDVLGVDIDEAACRTRRAAGHTTIRADVATLALGTLVTRVWGLIFSPPCITFSRAGRRAGQLVTGVLTNGIREVLRGGDTRDARRTEIASAVAGQWPTATEADIARQAFLSSLMLEPARYIAATTPEWVAMEQVPGALPLFLVYATELRHLGYSVWVGTVNAADYGVPQTRTRAVLIASRARTVGRPAATHYDPRHGAQLFGNQWVPMARAIGWGATERPSPTVTSGGAGTGGAEPYARQSRQALLAEQAAGRWVHRPGRNTGNGSDERWSVQISPAEAAALQSFPPGYPFWGNKTRTYQQIGNAIPPLLAAHVLAAATGRTVPLALLNRTPRPLPRETRAQRPEHPNPTGNRKEHHGHHHASTPVHPQQNRRPSVGHPVHDRFRWAQR
jgi:DNA (cytosine-5)-methyltransferase 1